MENIRIIPYILNQSGPTKEQIYCYKEIKQHINNGEYIDVEGYDQYLYDYVKECVAMAEEGIKLCNERIRNFCHIYEDYNYKINNYALVMLLFLDLYEKVERDIILSDYESLYRSAERVTSYSRYGLLLATLYRMLFNVAEDTPVPTDYFFVFAQFNWENQLTEFAKSHKEDIKPFVNAVIDEDFESNNINYLFRLYTFKEGSIYPEAIYTNEYLDSFWSNQNELTNRHAIGGRLSVDNILVADDDKDQTITYMSLVIREAENRYRQIKGLPRVGEGWISESQLFRKLEAAFPNEVVQQHVHPVFLGQQHYDVYFPERKIAIEYQGEQHYRPIEHFGGEEAFKKGQIRDERKRNLSKQNHILLIEVSANYDIEVLLKKIVVALSEQSKAYANVNEALSDAFLRAYAIDTQKEILVKSDLNKDLDAIKKEKTEKEVYNRKLDEEIMLLIKKKTPSEKTRRFNNVSGEDFDIAIRQYEEIEKIKKSNPSEALTQGMHLIEEGIYAAPAIYGCMAQILRSEKKVEEEFDLLLQMKCDFDYTNYDDRIRNLYKKIKE